MARVRATTRHLVQFFTGSTTPPDPTPWLTQNAHITQTRKVGTGVLSTLVREDID